MDVIQIFGVNINTASSLSCDVYLLHVTSTVCSSFPVSLLVPIYYFPGGRDQHGIKALPKFKFYFQNSSFAVKRYVYDLGMKF